jgi:hypothetical protein
MTSRGFPAPWKFEDHNDACFIVTDATGFPVAYVYYEKEAGRRNAAGLMTRDEARRIAAKIVKTAVPARGCGIIAGRPPGAAESSR